MAAATMPSHSSCSHSLRERQGLLEQGAPEQGGRAGHEVAPQEDVEGAAAVDPGQFEGLDLQRVEQRVAQRRFERSVDQPGIGVQQQQVRARARTRPPSGPGAPDARRRPGR